jgi:hypothetical protein
MTRSYLLNRFALITALLLFVPLSPTYSATDSSLGKLVIVKATYGDPDSDTALDVTAKVASMIKDNSLSVVANSANFGTPTGAVKKLKVAYTIDGLYRSKTVPDGETLDISTRLIIRKAVYGKLPEGPSEDVTDQVAQLVRKNALSLKASNEMFGDPAGGVVKKLRVDYTLDGVDHSTTVSENHTLTIPDKARK